MRDKTSPLATIYPSDFVEDFNGKQWTWQAVAILPFVDESTLLQVIAELDQMLTPEEKETTKQGRELLGVNMAHPIAQVSINRADMPLPTSLQLAGRVASHEKDIQAGTWLLWYNVPPPEPHLCDLLPQAQLCNPSLTNADLSEAQKVPLGRSVTDYHTSGVGCAFRLCHGMNCSCIRPSSMAAIVDRVADQK